MFQFSSLYELNSRNKVSCNTMDGILDIVVTIINYKKSTIDHAIYIKVFTDGTVSYITVSTDDVLNTTNNENAFTELTRFLKNTLR